VCFRIRPPGVDLNSINQTVLERLQLGGDAFVSSTSLDGVFWLRACVLNPSTTSEDLRALLDALRGAAAQSR
jgi:aromatic-L-amino-acid/L-tryptophan decarboxylase